MKFRLFQSNQEIKNFDFGRVDYDTGHKTIEFILENIENKNLEFTLVGPDFIKFSSEEFKIKKLQRKELKITIKPELNKEIKTEVNFIIKDSNQVLIVEKLLVTGTISKYKNTPLDPSSNFFIPIQWKNYWNTKPNEVFFVEPPPVPWLYEPLRYFGKTNIKKNEKLSHKNYINFFTHFVNVERERYLKDMQIYNLYNHEIFWKSSSKYFVVKVPGLSEDKPKLNYGDTVVVRVSPDLNDGFISEFVGFIIGKQKLFDCIFVSFSEQLISKCLQKKKFYIQFPFCKHFIFDMMVNTINEYKQIDKLFPDKIKEKNFEPIELKFFDKELNEEQKKVCRDVMSNSHIGAPYSIFGPPGTGKTRNLIEIVKLAWYYNENVRILITTPSDTASDIITLRLKDFQKEKGINMFRLNSFQRGADQAPPDTLQYCSQSSTGMFSLPSKYYIQKCEIIISTTFTTHLLNFMGIEEGYFQYIIVDEAAQAFEPEILMSSKLCGESTQFILAGDYNQLNPITRSPGNPLKVSLQERLSKYKLYQNSTNYHTMLTKNYRSHGEIFKTSSEIFYSNKLEKYGNDKIVNSMCQWSELNNKKCPLLFYGLKGTELREGESPSWTNPEEAAMVVKLTLNLLNSLTVDVNSTDIAILTPYRKQVQLIRKKLRSCNLSAIRVGTIEDYQGQESLITIISTVRCNPKRLSMDQKNSIGVVNHPKRFNVALTRAIALSIVVGDPNLLKIDKNWVKFIGHVKKNSNYKGCDCPKEIILEAENSTTEEMIKKTVESVLYETDTEEEEEEIIYNYLDDDTVWKF
eukprot:gene7590-11913_t